MTDVENLEHIIADIFGVKKAIRNKRNTNNCIAPLNKHPLNLFAFNFMNRLDRLSRAFAGDRGALGEIAEKTKNIGEARNSQWAGPYSELVALDFYAQFAEFFPVSYINILSALAHPRAIPARNGQQTIDIDLCLHLRHDRIFTDVKSFNCVHLLIFDQIFESVENFALEKLGKTILVGVDNLSSIDYIDVKNHLGSEIRTIECQLKDAVSAGRRFVHYVSASGIAFNFKIEYSRVLSTVKEYSPFAQAEAYKYKFLDYGSKLLDNEYSVITMVRNPWFNDETVDFGDFNNMFYRSLSRRTFMELLRNNGVAADYSRSYRPAGEGGDPITVREISQNLAGIVFIDDNSPAVSDPHALYSAYIYLNPNYANKPPLTIRKLEKYFHNDREVQIKDFDDFKYDNY